MYTLYRYRGIHNHIVSSQSSFQSALFHPQTHGNLWQRYLRWFCKRPYWKFHESSTQLRFGYKLAAHKGVPAAPHRNDVGTRGHLCQGKTVDKNCPLCWFSVCVFLLHTSWNYVKESVWNYMYMSTCTIKLDKIGNFCNKKNPRVSVILQSHHQTRDHTEFFESREPPVQLLLSWATTTFFVPNIYQRFFQNTPLGRTP